VSLSFLMRLAQRSRGEDVAVQPTAPPLFAPVPPQAEWHGGFQEEVAPAMERPARSTQPPDAGAVRVSSARPSQGTPPASSIDAPAVPSIRQTFAANEPAGAEHRHSASRSEPRIPRAAPSPDQPAARMVPEPRPPQGALAAPEPAAQTRTIVTMIERRIETAPAAPAVTRRQAERGIEPATTILPRAAERAAPPPDSRDRAAAEPAPAITVTIGRIEVRALPAAAPARPEAAPGRKPMSLSDYLDRRQERSR
jgi:hypothetical protein